MINLGAKISSIFKRHLNELFQILAKVQDLSIAEIQQQDSSVCCWQSGKVLPVPLLLR